jgi:hypothetical protein
MEEGSETMTGTKQFHLIAAVSTDNLAAIRDVLTELVGRRGRIERAETNEAAEAEKGEFRVEAEIEGATAKELNRAFLSALRKVERRTRLRSVWSSSGSIERYFDYVLKKRTP